MSKNILWQGIVSWCEAVCDLSRKIDRLAELEKGNATLAATVERLSAELERAVVEQDSAANQRAAETAVPRQHAEHKSERQIARERGVSVSKVKATSTEELVIKPGSATDRIVACLKKAGKPLSQKEIGKLTKLSNSTVSVNMRRLNTAKLVVFQKFSGKYMLPEVKKTEAATERVAEWHVSTDKPAYGSVRITRDRDSTEPIAHVQFPDQAQVMPEAPSVADAEFAEVGEPQKGGDANGGSSRADNVGAVGALDTHKEAPQDTQPGRVRETVGVRQESAGGSHNGIAMAVPSGTLDWRFELLRDSIWARIAKTLFEQASPSSAAKIASTIYEKLPRVQECLLQLEERKQVMKMPSGDYILAIANATEIFA